MKSRVQKNAELYNKMNSDTESSLDNSSLSSFAARLNEIDQQFEKLSEKNSEKPATRARTYREEPRIDVSEVEHNVGDTFENDYLLDFLEEVRNYNVRSGNQSQEDIARKFFGESPSEEKLPSKKEEEAIPVLEEPEAKTVEVIEELEPVATVYRSEEANLEETITMAIKDMDIYTSEEAGSETSETVSQIEQATEIFEPIVSSQEEVQEVNVSGPSKDELLEQTEALNLELLEQTEALKLELDKQNNDYQELSEEYSRAGRLLNVTIILLVFAIIVLTAIIVYQLVG